MFIWIGLSANPDFIQQVFGVPSAVQVNIEIVRLPELDNPLSEAVRTLVEQIRAQHHRCMRVSNYLAVKLFLFNHCCVDNICEAKRKTGACIQAFLSGRSWRGWVLKLCGFLVSHA